MTEGLFWDQAFGFWPGSDFIVVFCSCSYETECPCLDVPHSPGSQTNFNVSTAMPSRVVWRLTPRLLLACSWQHGCRQEACTDSDEEEEQDSEGGPHCLFVFVAAGPNAGDSRKGSHQSLHFRNPQSCMFRIADLSRSMIPRVTPRHWISNLSRGSTLLNHLPVRPRSK